MAFVLCGCIHTLILPLRIYRDYRLLCDWFKNFSAAATRGKMQQSYDSYPMSEIGKSRFDTVTHYVWNECDAFNIRLHQLSLLKIVIDVVFVREFHISRWLRLLSTNFFEVLLILWDEQGPDLAGRLKMSFLGRVGCPQFLMSYLQTVGGRLRGGGGRKEGGYF